MKEINFYLTIINKYGEYEIQGVTDEVFLYVKQLENHINNPDASDLKKIYKDRFVIDKLKKEAVCHMQEN